MDEQSFIGIPLAETWIRYARRHLAVIIIYPVY